MSVDKYHNYAVTYLVRTGEERTIIVHKPSAQEAAETVAAYAHIDGTAAITVRRADETLSFRVRWIAELVA